MFYKIFTLVFALFFITITFGQINNQTEMSEMKVDSVSKPESRSNFFIAGQFFNATRQIEDESLALRFDSLKTEEPINTQGIEVGTIVTLSRHLQLGVGFNFFSGGETWTFSDSLTDSSFSYTNKYRQIGVPLRLNFVFGNQLKYYGFVGVIPSSILNRRYESSYATAQGLMEENDVEKINEDLNNFQFIGTAGAGLSYRFGSISAFAQVEIRQHLTNTYTGIFLSHRQRLFGGSIGLTFNF